MTEAVWHSQFSEDLDFRNRTEPVTKYVICSTPRCGSHFLAHLMYSCGGFGYPLEYVNPTNLAIWEQKAATSNATSVIDFIMSRRTSPNGCFGIKAHYIHLGCLLQIVGAHSLVDEYKFIFLRRRDLLSQAVSLAYSRQTGSWISGMPESKPARYDASLIDTCLQEIASDNANWETFLSRLALPTLHVPYEEIKADPERELDNIAEFLGVACIERAGRNQHFMPKPESSEKKREWAQTFSQAARARFAKPAHVAKKRFLRRIIFNAFGARK